MRLKTFSPAKKLNDMGMHKEVVEHSKHIKNLKFAASSRIRAEIAKASPGQSSEKISSLLNKVIFYGLSGALIYYVFFRENNSALDASSNDSLLGNVLGEGEAGIKPEENIETRFSDVLVIIKALTR